MRWTTSSRAATDARTSFGQSATGGCFSQPQGTEVKRIQAVKTTLLRWFHGTLQCKRARDWTRAEFAMKARDFPPRSGSVQARREGRFALTRSRPHAWR
jgi:hypothetical protein